MLYFCQYYHWISLACFPGKVLAPGATVGAAGVQWRRPSPSLAPPPHTLSRALEYKYSETARAPSSARSGRPHKHQKRSAMKLVQQPIFSNSFCTNFCTSFSNSYSNIFATEFRKMHFYFLGNFLCEPFDSGAEDHAGCNLSDNYKLPPSLFPALYLSDN